MKNLIEKLNRLSCKDVSGLVSKGLEGRLSLTERFWIRVHLYVCAPCVRFLKQMKFISSVNEQEKAQTPSSESYSLSDEARERIRRQLDKH